jgi:flagellar biosynthesis anti-sigma factor FlgM
MKIEGAPKPSLIERAAASRATEPKVESAPPPRGERVEVSKLSKLLGEARGPEEVDTARIERLRDAIAAGTFKADAEAIADAMINEEK